MKLNVLENFRYSVHIRKCLDSFLVLTGIDFSDNLLQDAFGLALRKIIHVVILRRGFDEPFGLDIRNGSNIIFGGEDELVIQDPFRFMIQTRRRM